MRYEICMILISFTIIKVWIKIVHMRGFSFICCINNKLKQKFKGTDHFFETLSVGSVPGADHS